MSETPRGAARPMEAYGFLEDGGQAHVFPVSPTFWEELTSHTYALPEARLVGEGNGWLLSTNSRSAEWSHWELHPVGDEILMSLAGTLRVELELADGPREVSFTAGQACIVPHGIWHRVRGQDSARMLALTYGKGTQHRQD